MADFQSSQPNQLMEGQCEYVIAQSNPRVEACD